MNSINLTHPGGLPLDQDLLGFMQESYTSLQILARAVSGSGVSILWGCETVGSTVNPGWVIIQGEILPFEGGPIGTNVTIIDTPETAVFEDLATREVFHRRKAIFSVTGYAWGDFKPFTALNKVEPKGVIVMWSGAISDIPVGWALCDGTGGTPNLKGRFIVGYNPTDVDYNAVGKVGGYKNVTLDISQIPSHDHPYVDGEPRAGTTSVGILFGGPGSTFFKDLTNRNTGAIGGGQSHENRPPYYTLAFIIKL